LSSAIRPTPALCDFSVMNTLEILTYLSHIKHQALRNSTHISSLLQVCCSVHDNDVWKNSQQQSAKLATMRLLLSTLTRPPSPSPSVGCSLLYCMHWLKITYCPFACLTHTSLVRTTGINEISRSRYNYTFVTPSCVHVFKWLLQQSVASFAALASIVM